MFILAMIILASVVIAFVSGFIAVLLMDTSEWSALFEFVSRLATGVFFTSVAILVGWLILNGLGVSIEVRNG